jgi:hypothetical protein
MNSILFQATPQPTSEQLMIAQLIGGDSKADDPNQRQKIQKVKLNPDPRPA